MDINIVWIIAVLLLATGAVKGFRKGLVEGVVRITSYCTGSSNCYLTPAGWSADCL